MGVPMSKQPTRVLVVDDERFFRELIGEALERAGLPHEAAETGIQALKAAEDPGVGVVVLDIQLPDMNGLEVFRRLRDTRPELKVIILSAHTEQEYVLEALRLGPCDALRHAVHHGERATARA